MVVAVCTFAITLKAQPASAEVAYAVTETNKLIRFDTGQAGQTDLGTISGTIGGEQILSIDFRPLNGRLYGVSATRLYTIDPATAQAQPVSAAPFSVPLAGNADIDFDPVTGLIRVVTSTNQNMRIDPVNGEIQTVTDQPISGVTGIAAIAYTNNFASPDRATLFGISPASDQLARIGGVDLTDNGLSQNQGVATAIGVGGLGVDVDAPLGLDIAANDNEAFAVMTPAGDTESSLYTINLSGGGATLIREVTVGERLRGLALVSRAVIIYSLSHFGATPTILLGAHLSAAPGTDLPGFPVVLTESVEKIAVRPATGELVGLTSAGRLLNINPRTGQTSFLSQVSVTLTNPAVFSFHPTTDRLRIMERSNRNLSVVPDTGVATEETAHPFTDLAGGAYAADGTIYALVGASLYRFMDPPTGVATGVSLGLPALSGPLAMAPDGTAFVVHRANSSQDFLNTISTPDGDYGAQIGQLPFRSNVSLYLGLAVASPGRVRFSVPTYSALENAGSALITLQREAGTSGPINVRLSVTAGTATTPNDFIGFESIVEFADGEITKTLNVPIVNDGTPESEETVALTVTQPQLGATLGTPAAATLTIVDNDPSAPGAFPTITITSPTADPTYTASSLFINLAGTVTDSDSTLTPGGTISWSTDRGFSGTAGTSGAAPTLDWSALEIPLAPGVNTITVTAVDSELHRSTDTIVVTVTDLSYYLAEGATGTFFDLDLLLANPNATPVNVTATFLKPAGQGTVVQHYTLAPTSRRTVAVESIAGLENAEVSTIVTAPAATPIVVERTMRWDQTGYGAHTDKASPSPSLKWYFAEGSQGFFFTYLLLVNPHDQVNGATVTYFRENASPVTRSYDVAAQSRRTIDIGADADLVNQSFGMEVTFTLPGIAERAMYFGTNPLWIGGHESVGATVPSRTWFLAEGATGPFFETFVLFANPTAVAADVAVRYLPASGPSVARTYQVPAGQRLTVNIEGEDATLTNAAVATEIVSNQPIIVERAQYWPDPAPSWYEAHNSFGVTGAAMHWGLAEGRVGMTGNYQTYILLANPNATSTNVTITFLREDGTTVIKTFTVEAGRRFNVAVGGADVPEIANERFGASITSVLPIVVERAMYSDQGGVVWQAGTNATGTRLP